SGYYHHIFMLWVFQIHKKLVVTATLDIAPNNCLGVLTSFNGSGIVLPWDKTGTVSHGVNHCVSASDSPETRALSGAWMTGRRWPPLSRPGPWRRGIARPPGGPAWQARGGRPRPRPYPAAHARRGSSRRDRGRGPARPGSIPRGARRRHP